MLLAMITQPTRLLGQTRTTSGVFKKVTSDSSLSTGDVVIFVDETANKAAGDISSKILTAIDVTISNSVITLNNSNVIELTLGKSNNNWTFANTSSQLLGVTKVKELAWASGTTTYTISIANGDATITSTGENLGKFLYNNGSPRFTTYTSNVTSTMRLPQLYKKAYTVTYNANGGSGTMTDLNSPYFMNTTVTTKTSTFTPPSSKVFDHWNTAADNSGTSYAEGATFTLSANTTLYAQWRSTGPTVSIDPTEYNFGEVTVGTTPSPTHTFSVTPANLTADLTITVPSGYSVSPSSISQSTTTATNVTVTFTPTSVTSYNGNLTISGGGLASNVTASLTGSGTCAAPATALAFPSYGPLTYDGVSAATQVLAPSTGTGNGGNITYTMKTNPGSAGSIVNGNTFSATGTGTFVITATQALNGTTCGDVVDITIVVNGTAPSCEITPSTGHNFGAVLTNTSEYFDFSVAIANLEHGLTLSVPSGYEVSQSTIAANASSPVNVRVTFTPTNATTYNGNLTISGDDFDNDITATLSGTGDAGYTVTFNPYTGTCTPTSIRVIQGESIETLPTATADGATFYGWATSKVASTPTAPTSSIVSAPYTPTGNVTLHAVYKIAKEFDNTAACAGSYKIYAAVTNNEVTTNYYASGNSSTSGYKYGYTTTEANGKTFTLEKVQGYGSDEWAIKDGSSYVAYAGSGTDLKTQNSDYKWIITQGVKGTWRITAAGTLNANTIRGFIFQAGTQNKFGGYGISNVTPGAAYYDIEFGSASFTYNSETPVAKPTFNIAGGSYAGEQSVTISCTTQGATIYYTTNGSDPTASSTQYNGAITVDETMTIKAIAIKSGMANSTVAYATYSIVPLLTTMDEIFEAATTNGETAGDVAVSFNNWVVSGISGNENQIVYVTDNDGKGFIIYKYTNGFALNDKLSGTVAGTPLKLSYGSSQFTGLTASAEGLTVTHDGTITPVAKTISQLTSGVNTGAVVTISDLTYNGTNLVDGSSNTISPNSSLYTYGSALTSGHDYSSVTGVFVMYNSTKQIHPRSSADIVEVEYNITLNDVPSGCTIGTEGSITTAKYGQTVTLSQSAGAGYRFISWTVMNGVTPVAVENNAFTMPKGAVTVTATFAQTYDIAYNVTPANTGTVTAEPNPAIEGETVTLTIEPEDGYALKSISAYKTGEQSTPVSITENTITMPAYGVTVAAEFATEYSVTYNVNGGTGDAVVVKYGAGATVNAADVPGAWTAPEGKLFKNWKTVASGEGTEYEVGAEITNSIAANYVLYAQWRDIVYHVSFSVNGDIISERNVAYNTAIGELPEDPELAPLTFLGWSSTSATGTTDVTAAWKPTGENENVTVYAVFGNMSTDNFTLTGTTTNIPTGYNSYTWKIDDEDYFQTYNVMQGQYSTNRFIQYKSAGGYLYNIKDFGKIKSIVVTYYTGGSSNPSREIAIRINDEKFSGASGGTVMSVDYSGDVYTFTYDDEHCDYHYFSIYNSSNTSTIASIRINYEAAAPLTVNIIDEYTNMSDDIEATTCVIVEDGAVLTFSGENKGNANNLVIEDGGQLIASNPVMATVKKNIANASGSKAADDHWYTIATPVHTGINAYVPLSTTNLTSITDGKYDMFYLDEATNKWMNQKNVGGAAGYPNMYIGKGYLYRNDGTPLSMPGKTMTGDTTIAITKTNESPIEGINIIGNPFTHNIYKGYQGAIDDAALSDNFHYLADNGTWQLGDYKTAITPGMGIVVQTNTAKNLTIKDDATKATAEHAPTKAESKDLKFFINGNNYEDAAYAVLSNGYGLLKMSHPNEAAPLLYISQNDKSFSVANMSADTRSFNLCLKAKTTGKYTLSYKADGQFNYLHIIDRITGEDVDMLLEGEYSFIASPNDSNNRFIVKLGYNAANNANNDIFAYQNGNDIVVEGEGELQVFDVTGRQVKTQRINGVQTINLNTQGVYIFKLNDKVQKVVVR